MKWTRFFLILFLLPTLISAAFYEEDCAELIDKMRAEWERHSQLVVEAGRFGPNQDEHVIHRLREAIACCQRALGHCNKILSRIARKSRKERHGTTWLKIKKDREKEKKKLKTEIDELQNAINNILEKSAYEKATSLYQECEKKVQLAIFKSQTCPRRLNNPEEVISILNEIAKIYDEAASLAHIAYELIASYPADESQNRLKEARATCQKAVNQYKEEALKWPETILSLKNTLKERLATLKGDRQLLEEKGLKRSSYELQKEMLPILGQLVESDEGETYQEELKLLKGALEAFEAEADSARLTEISSFFSEKDFREKETKRKELFFKSNLLLSPNLYLQNLIQPRPRAIPLDGYVAQKEQQFTLYSQQFYRFLIQGDTPISHLHLKVYQQGELVHVENIALPSMNTPTWERYLTKEGMIFIPETRLQTEFGLDLRMRFVCDPGCNFSMILSQKACDSNYLFSVAIDEEIPLYTFNLSTPPPWQLGSLRKPALPTAARPLGKTPSFENLVPKESDLQLATIEPVSFPILDQFIEELGKDPLSLASHVYNEIAFVDSLMYQKEGVFYPPCIHRNPLRTWLEKKGSPWEQCQLLVYLLRKAGYPAFYATDSISVLPKTFIERLLLTKLPEDQEVALVQYPWVVFYDGDNWISLYPWMKEIQIEEGYDLYSLMPEEYASADRWILRYLKNDENILKWIDPDKDDTAANLFVRFTEEQLRKRGLSLSDVGIRRLQLKKQFSSWKDFPTPLPSKNANLIFFPMDYKQLFAKALIEISSHENPQKKISYLLSLADVGSDPIPIYFSNQQLHVQFEKNELLLDLADNDRILDVKINYLPFGNELVQASQTLSIAKGTSAALCFHFGGATPQLTRESYQKFSGEQEERKRLHALLAFVGTSYFEKCGRGEEMLAALHKITPLTAMAFGLAKLSPDLSKGPFKEEKDLILPQVDMVWFNAMLSASSDATAWHDHINRRQFQALALVNQSSHEHQILREVFNDEEAVSTVKLLQLAHREQQKKDGEEEGFLIWTSSRVEVAEKTPETAEALYFPQFKDLNLRQLKARTSSLWNAIRSMLECDNSFSHWVYAYMTPGVISSHAEAGVLIFHPVKLYALITSNNLLFHGGLGRPLSNDLRSFPIDQWWLFGSSYSYYGQSLTLQTPSLPLPHTPSPAISKYTYDVRAAHKPESNSILDPVDVVTGAFYIDEIDLVLPGPFPLEIRRNYSSQNPQIGDLGVGWKLSLDPYLIKQEDKLYAAEADGTVIVYSYNQETNYWEVSLDDNPDLWNFNQNGIGSIANPFHAYIENDILYGSDGSKRMFEQGLLRKWADSRGNTLTFSYKESKLSRIESSNGDFFGLRYYPDGKVSEIYAKDGRRIYYSYSSRGDLINVTLPNTAIISYEYDHEHRIIRETKPHGKVIENIYLDGKVKKQRSPMGLAQAMITTGTFDYQEGETIVTDAHGGKTNYKIYKKQIYKITDPLGYQTLQAWFIDKNSWFDPITEQIVPCTESGGAARSLKATTDKRGLTTFYHYDSRGNAIEMGLEGEDLTGSGESLISKKLLYNEHNLCIQEEVLDQKTVTTYDAMFPYLPQRIEKYSGNTLITYVELKYNSLGQMEKEDRSGSITRWRYDSRGFPFQKIQETGTEDPEVVTIYSYSPQGQCVQIQTSDAMQENSYDIMGNPIASQTYSLSGALLSATYIGYNLNSAPIWKQTANSENTIYFDHHASGLIKASRRPGSHEPAAYTLYEYDALGYLLEEVDPLGFTTYRDYDALGKVICETRVGLSTTFTYESGGLLETTTSPSGAKTTHLYTTNGLPKEEIYPDGTKSSIIYDILGRPIRETKNGITLEITYDDPHRRVIYTNSKTTEIQEFDARGNLIRFTDPAGYTSEKTYDGLNRLKTEVSPTGERTLWNYQKDTIICTLQSGEKKIQRYQASQVAESQAIDAQGNLIASSSYNYNPETDVQTLIEGEEITTTWMNVFGLPLKVQKGDLTTTYEYDLCGNCIAISDGDGRTTRQTFDELRRIIQKELPDGGVIQYTYDSDSNLTEYHLPNGTIWTASYDSMGRKTAEELQAATQSSQRWEYTYENGYLKEAKDPLQRLHAYLYDPQGRLAQDTVDNWQRIYTYDSRGLLSSAEQIGSKEQSQVERSYDPGGRLILETIYLNSNLIQQTRQTWEPSSRSLQIDNHTRNFTYQNNQLIQVSTKDLDLSYTYHLSGSLKNKSTPLSTTNFSYNAAGLPENIHTKLSDGSYQESLDWTPSGKLSSYSSPAQQKQFTYTARGYLQSAGAEKYEFDFGAPGIGIRTAAPGSTVPEDGLDAFGKILTEISDQNLLATTYNLMGQVIAQNQRQFAWDPWGRLLQVSEEAFTWEASYDAFGRRLQTRYTPDQHETLITTSLYDPEEEFQEIGIKYGDKTFWKIYGLNSCDAITDETGASVVLMRNALDQLVGVVSEQGTFYSQQFPSSYGPQGAPIIPTDLLTYAQSLTWHGQAQDPTGLIWMGARYYDPKGGRFLSPDPISYPICLDLYAYAGGDPINYWDPDGRFFSHAYKTVKGTVLNVWHSPQFQGAGQMFGGIAEMGAGAGISYGTGLTAAPLGFIVFAHGADHFITGFRTLIAGRYSDTATSQLLQKTGMPRDIANSVDSGTSMIATMGGTYVMQCARSASPAFSLPNSVGGGFEGLQAGKNFKSFTRHNYRDNLKELTGISPSGKSMHAHHVFVQQLKEDFLKKGINVHEPRYMTWWESSSHLHNAPSYSAEWISFMKKNPNVTKEQILEKGRRMMNKHGMDVNY